MGKVARAREHATLSAFIRLNHQFHHNSSEKSSGISRKVNCVDILHKLLFYVPHIILYTRILLPWVLGASLVIETCFAIVGPSPNVP